MKFSISSGCCMVALEDGEPFSGGKLYIDGERISNGFDFNFGKVKLLDSNNNSLVLDDNSKETLFSLIKKEYMSQGYNFLEHGGRHVI
jgi:hypothetical protein